MKTEISRQLRSEAAQRAESHPVDGERALVAGSRRYWWKVLAAYASATAVIILLAGTALLGRLAGMELTLTAMAVTPAAVSLQLGETTVLTAQLTYSDGSTAPATAAVWTSSDPNVAQVDGAGNVTAFGPGTATITVAQSGVTGTSSVTVPAPTVTGLIVTPTAVSLQLGETTVLTAQLTYSDGSTAPATAAVWTSSDANVAQVDGAGNVTAFGPGTATITAAQSGVTGNSKVTVAAPTVTGLILTPTEVSLQVRETTPLTAQLTYSDGSTAPAAEATWTSSQDKIAQVDGAGNVTAVANGTATITATQFGFSGTSSVTVAAPPTNEPVID